MKRILVLALGAGALALGGCSVGDAPKGLDAAQVQTEFSKQDPQKQIQGLMASPLPAAEKEKRIKAIEDQYGIKRGAPPTSSPTPGH